MAKETNAYPSFINGCSEFLHGGDVNRRPIKNMNPATGEILGTIWAATSSDVDDAVGSSSRCFLDRWQFYSDIQRAGVLREFARLVYQDVEELSYLDALETGKPLAAAASSAKRGCTILEHHAAVIESWSEKHIRIDAGNTVYVSRAPYGVVGAIIPWNFPVTNFLVKVAPALAAGNTVVVKPSEYAPSAAHRLAELALEAGMPAGCVNVIQGDGETTGQGLARHARVKKVAFTGSTSTGLSIMSAPSSSPKSYSMELGGKNSAIVLASADLDRACDAAIFTAFSNAGQTCTAGSRLLLEDSIAEEFLARLVEKANQLQVGDPFDPLTQVGPVISRDQVDRIDSIVGEAQSAGASLACGGGPSEPSVTGDGFYIRPTILVHVPRTCLAWNEELFGPVLSVSTFESLDEAVLMANDTEFGLATSVWTSELTEADRVAAEVDCGIVWINTVHALDPAVAYGGWKNSGVGIESGSEGIFEYMQTKSVWTNTQAWRSPWN